MRSKTNKQKKHCWKHNFNSRAARYSHLSVVEKLLELGANPNAMNKFGMVPLHHAAVAGGSPEVIVALIKAGADVSRFIISILIMKSFFRDILFYQMSRLISKITVDGYHCTGPPVTDTLRLPRLF